MTSIVGTGQLVRHALRRDRVLATTWVLVLLVTCYASAAATASLYPTEPDRVRAAEAINATPAIVALYGPILDVHSPGELAMTKMTVLYAVFVALMCLVLVRRHTRVEEESGRTELVAGTAIGRSAPLASATLEATLVSIVLGALAALGNIVAGLPVAGSVAFGASWAGVGLVAIGLTAVACQVSASARTCAAIASSLVGVLFLVRAVGDTSLTGLSWLSPFGWSTQLRAYSGPRWWVLLLYVALAGVLVVLAQVLHDRRDLGSGMLAARPGRAHGSPRLSDAVALAVKLHGAMLATWTVAMLVVGGIFGAIAPNIGALLDSPAARAMIERIGGEGVLEETLIAAELSILAVVMTCFALTVVGHSATDEHDGRTEQVLATATSRSRAFAATVVVALAGATWLLLVTGVAVTLGYGVVGGRFGNAFGDLVAAALVQAPAVWVVTALAAACLALGTRWAVAGWAVLVLFVSLGQLGELLRLPGWVIGLSPYTHVPQLPVESFAAQPELTMTLIAALVLIVAWARYRSRDIG